jgi:Domain of unknown function (DUF6852)/Domain of unknown function (DUF5606)
MEYSKLVAVTGLPGLYELINSKTDGAVVRSLDDNSTKFASSRIHNFSHLESIEVFTVGDNVNLVEIFQAMSKAKEAMPDAKDNSSVKKYFEKVYPDLDFERVYPSDLKKMVKWFEVLKKNDVELKLSEPPAEEEESEEEKEELVVVSDGPAKKESKASKSSGAKKEEVKEDKPRKKEAKAEEKPVKKAAAKKKETDKKEKPAKKTTPKKKK